MGTTLSNGVYLPDEGERNCYAGLKLNWETLDQKVADISALQSAIAGALHREIVVSLPTTDIDTATIYMILNGTSATENIYDEYMYISNAWELIGTSATDLTNYYTKGEVDSKLLLKASASDLTSHTGDTTIHVTASDKTKWNTVALIKHLRLVNAQVGSATTIPFSDFDDTNGIKAGDKCADLDVKVFEITAVDTANQTVTVTPLLDIALDANVVHTSGNETVTGFKTFENIRLTNSIRAIALDGETVDLNDCYSSFAPANSPKNGNVALYSCNTDTDTANITNLPEQKAFYLISITIRYLSNTPTVKQILITRENVRYERFCNSGVWSAWVKDTDKFVTTDTVQDVAGNKNFKGLITTTPDATLWPETTNTTDDITWLGDGSIHLEYKSSGKLSDLSGGAWSVVALGLGCFFFRINNSTDIRFKHFPSNTVNRIPVVSNANRQLNSLTPETDNTYDVGDSTRRWKTFNGVSPSSLSLPSSTSVDISAYITDLSGVVNNYSAPADGWVYVRITGTGIRLGNTNGIGQSAIRETSGTLACSVPVCAGDVVNMYIVGTSVAVARFHPCKGNV